ncbi:MAG TPA: proprotein convertase P-domain-containing protein [Phycisphaerae bacterium]|nr:proprotein convertase P-domain-containing protein [Phycisphaerae bacterium]
MSDRSRFRRTRRTQPLPIPHALEELESRTLLSSISLAAQLAQIQQTLLRRLRPVQIAPIRQPARPAPVIRPGPVAHPIAVDASPAAGSSPAGNALTPAQVRHAYGIDQVFFGSIVGDGTGQTIAIIDAYDYPTAQSDLHAFDQQFGLPDPPSLKVVAQDGSSNLPPVDPVGPASATGQSTWEEEEALDLQWAHAIAPGASLILVEADNSSFTNLVQAAVVWAKTQPQVTAISMSFGASEFSGEGTLDSIFTTPAGHSGITFLASTGDNGSPGGYPAYSPNVLSVGGTTLNVSGTSYVSETAWSGSGGGVSSQESLPSFQSSIHVSTAGRNTPDVSMLADPNTGVAVYDSYDFGADTPWITVGGTSLATPMWAGIISIVNQGRAQAGIGSLDGPTQTVPMIYSLPSTDFHDITSGSNGAFSAKTGYDLVTGRGSPIANLLIPDMVGVGAITGIVYQDNNGDATFDNTDSPLPGVTVYLDGNNNGVYDAARSATYTSSNVPLAIPDNNPTGASSTLAVAPTGVTITDVNITFTITHTFDRDLTAYLIAPDGTTVTLFSGVGGSGDNFFGTTLDDSASTTISSASPPFAGTYKPSAGTLSTFNGHSPDGTWTFKVVDGARLDTGSIIAWSLTIGLSAEPATTTNSQGQYSFTGLKFGTYTIRQIVPTGFIQTQPSPGVPPASPPGYSVTVAGTTLNQNFGDFPTTFTASGNGDGYTLSLDKTGTILDIYTGVDTPPFFADPTYTIPLNELSNLSFTFTGANESLVIDYANGSPIPAGNISLNASQATNPMLSLYGDGANPQLRMTDTQIGAAGGPAITWNNLFMLNLDALTANYYGNGSAVPNVSINNGAIMFWRGTGA